MTCRFAGREHPDHAVGPNRNVGIAPEVFLYERDRPVHAVELFNERLTTHGIETATGIVLARRHELTHEINGFAPVKCQPGVTTLARAAACLCGGRTLRPEEIRAVDGLLARFTWDLPLAGLDSDTRWRVRQASMLLLRQLPALDGSLKEWIGAARQVAKTVVASLADPPAVQPSGHLKAAQDHDQIVAADCFAPTRVPLQAVTVHAVKGESHGAVLLVAEARKRGQTQGELWSHRLKGHDIDVDELEELRIAYVALSRAEKYCAVALPSDHSGVLADYLAVGFVEVSN